METYCFPPDGNENKIFTGIKTYKQRADELKQKLKRTHT